MSMFIHLSMLINSLCVLTFGLCMYVCELLHIFHLHMDTDMCPGLILFVRASYIPWFTCWNQLTSLPIHWTGCACIWVRFCASGSLGAFNTNMHSRMHADSFTAPMSTHDGLTKHKNTGHLTGFTNIICIICTSTANLLTFPSQLAAKPGVGCFTSRTLPERCGLDAGKLCSAEPYRLIRGVIGVP
jgi:hypothetical protein